jgi:hypothetical protein
MLRAGFKRLVTVWVSLMAALALSHLALADGSGPILVVPATGGCDSDLIEACDHTRSRFSGNHGHQVAPREK